MASFSYKVQNTKTLKVKGDFNVDAMTVLLEDEGERTLKSLFADFDGEIVDISIKTSSNDELDIPVEEEVND